MVDLPLPERPTRAMVWPGSAVRLDPVKGLSAAIVGKAHLTELDPALDPIAAVSSRCWPRALRPSTANTLAAAARPALDY